MQHIDQRGAALDRDGNALGEPGDAHDAGAGGKLIEAPLNTRPRPNVGQAPTERMYKDVDAILEPAVAAIGGTYMNNPRWKHRLLGKHLVTAHPLGGCATADGIDGGVVDDSGRVFSPGGEVHEGLYVCDGSVIPRSIGVNPFLTISMFAERAAESLRAELALPAYDADLEGDDR